jgi:hypothetical protein
LTSTTRNQVALTYASHGRERAREGERGRGKERERERGTRKQEALTDASHGRKAIVLELQVGQVNCGAGVEDIDEHLLAFRSTSMNQRV